MHQTLKPPYPHVSQTPEASAFQAQKSVCSSDMLKIQLLVKSLWKVEWRCQVRLVPLLGQVLDHPIAFDRFRRPARAGGAERSNAVAELECDTTWRCLYPDSVAIEEPAKSARCTTLTPFVKWRWNSHSGNKQEAGSSSMHLGVLRAW